MPRDAWSLRNLFKRRGTRLEAQNVQEINFTAILDLRSQIFGRYSVGPSVTYVDYDQTRLQ